MKKIISAILLLAMLSASFSSCGKNPDNSTNYVNDRYIYKVDGMTLYRYDVIDKTCVLACPDALCNHGSDCPVTVLEETTITDRYIFLRKGIDGRAVTMSVYDLLTNEITEIANGVQSNPVSMANEYAYFTMSHFEYNENGEVEKEVFNLYRYNTLTAETIAFTETPLNGSIMILHYDDEKIVWTGISDGCFSSDYDFKNIAKADSNVATIALNTIDGYLYKGGFGKDEYGNKGFAQKTNLKTGETIVFFNEADTFRWANQEIKNGVLYRESDIFLVEIDGEEKYVRKGINTIVYVDTKDPSRTFIYELPENLEIASVAAEMGEKWYLGDDYTSTYIYIYSYDEEGNKYVTYGIFVIDCKTGEYFVIENKDTKHLSRVQTTEEETDIEIVE